MRLPGFAAPETLLGALGLVSEHGDDALVMGGGTAVALLLRQQLLDRSLLISLQRCRELVGVSVGPAAVRLGATTTYHELERSPELRRVHPGLARTAARVATPRIRNQGTVGGCLALADPHFDLPVSLLALDAIVVLTSLDGTRRVALDDFIVGFYETAARPNEILASVEVPLPAPGDGLAFEKLLTRSIDDYATVDVAAWVRLDETATVTDVRVALGSVGPRVLRARAAESALRGRPLTERSLAEAAEAAGAECDPETDARGSSEYKRDLVRALVPRLVRDAAKDALERRH